MPNIPTNRLKPGMVLKDAVRDITGRLLLGEGVTLSEKHLNIFKTWGIAEVAIQGDSDTEEQQSDTVELDEAAFAAAKADIERLFIFNNPGSSTVMKEIFRLSVLNRAGALKPGECGD